MWIQMNDAMLSVVAHRDHPDSLLVRSRVAGDIERVFPGAAVWEEGAADYRYRAVVGRREFASAVAARVQAIDYPNFKASVRDPRRASVYHRVWSVFADAYGAFGRRPGEGPMRRRSRPEEFGLPDSDDIDAYLND